jgi:hypothetical protein
MPVVYVPEVVIGNYSSLAHDRRKRRASRGASLGGWVSIDSVQEPIACNQRGNFTIRSPWNEPT